ncbi:MAG: DUF3089 domain-containing protein [Steroidobacteraceae bacterium]|jgi:hypothetical protein|nr:DUF3089 domain-containing protein [Steroidobacteraceae bacterium]
MKRTLIVLAVVLAILASGAIHYRDWIVMMITFQRLAPDRSFGESAPPPAPDYSDPTSWAALPERADLADSLPGGGVEDRQASAEVDVFFVHPTTFYKASHWNQPLDDELANQITDAFVMRGQASVFNSCCRVYAPRYRQATLYSFMDSSGSGAAALELAYGDVERAFDYFIERFNQNRPFILAAHSQGSLHLRTLLERRITGTALRERLVAAYPIGFNIDREMMSRATPDIPVCESAEQLGCLVSWNAAGPDMTPFMDPKGNVCVNPLTWRADDELASHERNLGAVFYPGAPTGRLFDLKALPPAYLQAKPVLETAVADAQCKDGLLVVSELRSEHYTARPMGRDNLHLYDYALFHMNLRRNAQHRAERYLQTHPGIDGE